MIQAAVILILGIAGLLLLSWGAYREERRRIVRKEAAESIEWPTHYPECVTEDEMRERGWEPLNDGSGLWVLKL